MKTTIWEKAKVFIQPVTTKAKNIISFICYPIKRNPWWRKFFTLTSLLLTILGVLRLSYSLYNSIKDVANVATTPHVVLFWSIYTIVTGLITYWSWFCDYVKKSKNRATEIYSDPNTYANVLPQSNNWERWTIRIFNKAKEHVVSECVFVCPSINKVLRQKNTKIPLMYDYEYENAMRNVLRDNELWKTVFYPFLQYNYRNSMAKDKQFYNEKKFGLSKELNPNNPIGFVHKTCYFDSYLLNIIPGKYLTPSRDLNIKSADATKQEDLLCYSVVNNEKKMRETGICKTANEPGVTTLCIHPDGYIQLWRQNNKTQCSSGFIVASGSGSADWKDCKDYFGDEDGFRKAIITGMNRELWEESDGKRKSTKERFIDNIDTRITGYFRWLSKNGKSEFVGVSRLKDRTLSFRPEESEVSDIGENVNPGKMPAQNIHQLIRNLTERTDFSIELPVSPRTENSPKIPPCETSVSCSMAMLMLREVCTDYCKRTCKVKNCPYRKDHSEISDFICKKAPYDVLF